MKVCAACGIASGLRKMCPGLAFRTGKGAVVSKAESLNWLRRYCLRAGMFSSVAGYGIFDGRGGGVRRSPLLLLTLSDSWQTEGCSTESCVCECAL